MIKYKNYVMEANDYGGWVLSELKVRGKESKKAGEEIKMAICYPSSLKSCFKRILDIEFSKIANEKDFTISEAIRELERLQNELQNELDKNIKEELE